jgi:hypothetical protein
MDQNNLEKETEKYTNFLDKFKVKKGEKYNVYCEGKIFNGKFYFTETDFKILCKKYCRAVNNCLQQGTMLKQNPLDDQYCFLCNFIDNCDEDKYKKILKEIENQILSKFKINKKNLVKKIIILKYGKRHCKVIITWWNKDKKIFIKRSQIDKINNDVKNKFNDENFILNYLDCCNLLFPIHFDGGYYTEDHIINDITLKITPNEIYKYNVLFPYKYKLEECILPLKSENDNNINIPEEEEHIKKVKKSKPVEKEYVENIEEPESLEDKEEYVDENKDENEGYIEENNIKIKKHKTKKETIKKKDVLIPKVSNSKLIKKKPKVIQSEKNIKKDKEPEEVEEKIIKCIEDFDDFEIEEFLFRNKLQNLENENEILVLFIKNIKADKFGERGIPNIEKYIFSDPLKNDYITSNNLHKLYENFYEDHKYIGSPKINKYFFSKLLKRIDITSDKIYPKETIIFENGTSVIKNKQFISFFINDFTYI